MAYFDKGTFVGRAWATGGDGPILITVRDGMLLDITSRAAPTMRDLMEMGLVAWIGLRLIFGGTSY